MLFALVSTMLLPAHAQSESPSPQVQETADSGDVYGLIISILIIAGAAALGMGMKRLFHKKKRDERHGFRRR